MWRRVKTAADGTLIAAVTAAVAWTAVGAGFSVQRAAVNRTIADVHLGSDPLAFSTLAGVHIRPAADATLRRTVQTEIVAISIVNDGPDGVVARDDATLTGPYLVGAARLKPDGTGYMMPDSNHGIHLRGTVTVDCAAATAVAAGKLDSTLVSGLAPTEIVFTVDDTNGDAHQTKLVIDTTAFALQGQVCTS